MKNTVGSLIGIALNITLKIVNHYVICLKLTYYCKSTILQLFKKKLIPDGLKTLT